MAKWRGSKIHGVLTLGMVFAAFALGIIAEFGVADLAGWIGVAASVLWMPPVAWSFCAKCCCRLDCGHVLLGLLTRLLPARKAGPYTKPEGAVAIGAILVPVAWHAYWLLAGLGREVGGTLWYLVAFGALFVLAAVDVLLHVCPRCPNEACPFNRKSGPEPGRRGP